MDRRDVMSMAVGLVASLHVAAGSALATTVQQGATSGPARAIGAARAAAAAETGRARDVDATAGQLEGASGLGEAAVAAVPAGGASEAAPLFPAPVAPQATTPAGAESVAPVRSDALPTIAMPKATSLYNPAKQRDPFRGPNLVAPDGVARTPLERYQIGQLKLVGVIWETESPRAMVEDSVGLGYIVSAGTAIGSSGGVVRRIEPRRVLIEERVTDFYGDKRPREVVMELPEEDRSP